MGEVQDEARLLERARRGDETAFTELFTRHQRSIFRFAAYMGGRDAADDIVQETFLVVLRQTDRHDKPRGSVLAYLLGIARRIMLKRFRGSGAVTFTDDIDEEGIEAVAVQATPLEALTRAETAETVRAAVESLPPVYREAVVLCDLQELDYDAAAEVVGCPVGTTRSRLHRARVLLAAKLSALQPAGRGQQR
jgi:RNA polymerase sigma-70 factor (ECF subfamily)